MLCSSLHKTQSFLKTKPSAFLKSTREIQNIATWIQNPNIGFAPVKRKPWSQPNWKASLNGNAWSDSLRQKSSNNSQLFGQTVSKVIDYIDISKSIRKFIWIHLILSKMKGNPYRQKITMGIGWFCYVQYPYQVLYFIS